MNDGPRSKRGIKAYLGVSVSVRAASVTVLSTLTERMKLFMIEMFWIN